METVKLAEAYLGRVASLSPAYECQMKIRLADELVVNKPLRKPEDLIGSDQAVAIEFGPMLRTEFLTDL